MKACTAVVTQLSYNHSSDKRYRAEVEFVSQKEWEEETTVLLKDLLDDNGLLSREHLDDDSAAGVAFAKVKALYPGKTKDQIVRVDAEAISNDFASFLGTTKDFEESVVERFRNQLQPFIDGKSGKGQSSNLALWACSLPLLLLAYC